MAFPSKVGRRERSESMPRREKRIKYGKGSWTDLLSHFCRPINLLLWLNKGDTPLMQLEGDGTEGNASVFVGAHMQRGKKSVE